MTEPKEPKRRGRPPGTGKPAAERYVLVAFRVPPALRDEINELVPEQERSEFFRKALRPALAARRRGRQAKE
jgi:hypothetical protein